MQGLSNPLHWEIFERHLTNIWRRNHCASVYVSEVFILTRVWFFCFWIILFLILSTLGSIWKKNHLKWNLIQWLNQYVTFATSYSPIFLWCGFRCIHFLCSILLNKCTRFMFYLCGVFSINYIPVYFKCIILPLFLRPIQILFISPLDMKSIANTVF